MIAEPEHDEVAELLGAYALDAVDGDEVRRVEAHLAECPRCRIEADQLRQVAAALGMGSWIEGDDPPAEVWGRIATRTRTGSTAAVPDPPDLSTVTGTRPPQPESVTPLDPDRRRRPGRRWVWSAALAATSAAAAIVVLAVGLVHTQGRVHELQSALAEQAPGVAVRAALSTPGHRVVDLRTPAGADVAQLVVQPSGVGYVVASTMSRLPLAETYQLWASIDGRAISLGLLGSRLRPGGAFNLGSAANAARELMVTVEPAAGVVAPDHAPVATALLRLA